MRPTPEDLTRVRAIEVKLAEVDPIMRRFCEHKGLKFSKTPQDTLYPKRMMWVREEIDRCMFLTPSLTFQEILDRGFYPEMPWSLEAVASNSRERVRMLEMNVFRDVPYSRLSEILANTLENGLSLLRKITREDVLKKGVIVEAPPRSEEDHARLGAVAAKFAELDSIIQRFCTREGLYMLPHGKATLWRGIRLPEDGRRYILLNVNTSFPELMKRGFDPGMPCSLEIHASSPEEPDQPKRFYRRTILRDVPYFRLIDVLGPGLKDALAALRALTREDILTYGEEM